MACPQLSVYERSLLKDFVEILTPFEEATDFTQKQNSVSVSFIIPGIRGLRKAIEMMNVKYNSDMLSTLKNSLNRRMEIYEQREHYIYAAILDPRFKFDWCTGSELLRIEARFRYFLSSRSTLISDPLISDSSQSPTPKRGRLLSYMASSTSTTANTLAEIGELDKYLSHPRLSEDDDPLVYWNLHQTALPTLAKLASSAPVERLFSIAGKLFKPDSCSMSDEVFQKLIMIRCNSHL